jgi:hypothetical protein
MVQGTALAEISGNRQPGLEVDVFPKTGKAILGAVNHQGFIEGEVFIDGVSEESRLQRVEVELKDEAQVELGFEERLYPIGREDAKRLESATTDYFRLRNLGEVAADGAAPAIGFMVEGVFYRGAMSDLAGVRGAATA